MADEHVMAGLTRKRAELAGRIEHEQTALRQLLIDLDNLDATLRLFVPDIELAEIRPKPFPPRHAAFRGEVSRIVLASLRQATGPLTSHDIAQHVMAERGLNTSDKRLVRLVGKRVGAYLRHQGAKRLVRSGAGPEAYLVWEIVRWQWAIPRFQWFLPWKAPQRQDHRDLVHRDDIVVAFLPSDASSNASLHRALSFQRGCSAPTT